jgi:hypothetical protein
MIAPARPADLFDMPSTQQPTDTAAPPRPKTPIPPRVRLEEMLGRDFTNFLLDVLADPQGRRGSSSPYVRT